MAFISIHIPLIFLVFPTISFHILSFPFICFHFLSFPFIAFHILSCPFVSFQSFHFIAFPFISLVEESILLRLVKVIWIIPLAPIGTFFAIYPGHGLVGGMVLLEEAEKYLTDFQYVVRSSDDVDMAIEAMLALYPEYKMPEILEASVRSAMTSKNLVN